MLVLDARGNLMAHSAVHLLVGPVTTSRHPVAPQHSSAPCLARNSRPPQRGLHAVHAQRPDENQCPPSSSSSSPADGAPSPPTQNLPEAPVSSGVRSQDDASLLEDARGATRMGEKMTREQYNALKRKIGGTYRDFFKESIEVEGDFVDEGWVDKSCRICKRDTASEPRTVDKYGRYAHVTCLEKSSDKTNFFSRLFGM